MGELAGRVALITGGASGIGAAAARVMAREGAAVAVADFDAKRAGDVAQQLCAGGARAVAIAVDVAQPAQVEAMVRRTVAELGRLDALVNSAGVSPPMLATHEYPLADWDRCAELISFLCSPRASFVTGAYVLADGGFVVQ